MPSVYTEAGLEIISRTVLASNVGSLDYVARPDMIEVDGIWIMVYVKNSGHAYSNGVMHMRVSGDQGTTWTGEDTHLDGSAIVGAPFDSDPPGANAQEANLFVAPNGDALLTVAQTDESRQFRSTDQGRTWVDESMIAVTELYMEGGRGAIVGSELYIASRVLIADPSPPNYPNNIYKTDDDGATWDFVGELTPASDPTGEVGLAWTGGTNLLAIMRRTSSNSAGTYLARSDDLGATWGNFENFTTITGHIFHQPDLYRVGSRIYLTGRSWDASSTDRHNAICWTDDDGDTWSPVVILGTDLDAGYDVALWRGDRKMYVVCYEGDSETASVVGYLLDIPSHTSDKDYWLG